jgi:hypothetical protein
MAKIGGRSAGVRAPRGRSQSEPVPTRGNRRSVRSDAQSGRGTPHRQGVRQARHPWWRRRTALGGAVVAVVASIVVAILAVTRQGGSTDNATIGTLAPSGLVRQVTTVSPAVISAVGAGKLSNGDSLPAPIHAISGTSLTVNGKPEVLFIGGEYCSHCAGLRWSVINALGRFGAFSNLQYMRTSAAYGNLATLAFYHSTYSSQYVRFVPVENRDRDANELQPLTAEQQHLLATVGGDAYPLVDIAGRYANDAGGTYGGGYDTNLLAGKDWSQIARALSNPSDPLTQGLVGTANYLTAAICTATHDQPASACGVPAIRHLAP